MRPFDPVTRSMRQPPILAVPGRRRRVRLAHRSTRSGSLVTVTFADGPDSDNYSDRATFEGDVSWVVCGSEWARAGKPEPLEFVLHATSCVPPRYSRPKAGDSVRPRVSDLNLVRSRGGVEEWRFPPINSGRARG